ncbi:pyrroloquinoline quinone biosynthesis peptide chaperone PqqD [Thalassococcus sp. S3]|uniref:pyrroloquinoline quinone biosynthesis peptide chaperone PqqD n=1 Tax=Thalassococcus sp. S3 TaxID=2017482 RepID=UPI00102421CC|nr:pyrroloquinoline quinone biosynthesis peptide chaperone PqqD [Thalassococcus sp. S3]QBF30625.1 pyrroloquinoline quinone biosynthesis peptide chaperone PqqD [Thalassococcus sp. S3]
MTLALGPEDIPVLPRGVRVQHDHVRDQMVLLAPEKAVLLDAIGVEILRRVTGEAGFGAIIDDLVAQFGAPREQIEGDVQRFLVGLRARRYLDVIQ